ncbi:uncharacterized protein LOC120254225 [Dioscorea cayenensis subsp. rotundata]|uniref:Uncharacterized protein LOC120254225 n=1 Tax=Dioscorea cayennensis subsp. rotundata TaxID=55577 RepID=A0AB40ATQ9_DIOCR|nr:uncharacterized protein LOC120254225 [Dioscorea cayenensis subsp. rotundata]
MEMKDFFHLAFAIVDNETDDNWTWFTSTLGDVIYGDDDYTNIITFISDRSKGLVNAIAKVFPSSPHAYCLRHLHANFLKSNGQLGKSLKDECWSLIMKIAYACTSFEYDEAFVLALLPLNPVIFYIYYLNGMLHGAIDTTYVHVVRFKMMNMMYNRRNCCLKWESYLCPVIHKKIEVIVEESRCLLIGCSNGEQFEVVDHQSNSVNLCARTYSCRHWQVYGIPCKYACAAIMQTDTNVHRFIESYYTVKSYKLIYKESIFPVPDHGKPLDDSR